MNAAGAGAGGAASIGDGADATDDAGAKGHVRLTEGDGGIDQVTRFGDGIGELSWARVCVARWRRAGLEARGGSAERWSGRSR